MKKTIYITISIFVAILIIVMIWALNTPVKMVEYEDGIIREYQSGE